ncbi:hypothetical protein NYE69_14300 [Paenibacillus sp. FSL R5-0527]|uniref:hypothetical protein n=1 Tax=Paenibacillus sp. FSL R5-0527 TaxID=2975321 RepID=UPI0030FA58C9
MMFTAPFTKKIPVPIYFSSVSYCFSISKGEWMFLPAYGIMEKEAVHPPKRTSDKGEPYETVAGFIFSPGTAGGRIVDDPAPARPV